MSWTDVVERQHGTVAALLIVEGMTAAFSTSAWQFPDTLVSPGTPATRHLPQQYDHFLDADSVAWAYGIDYRAGDLDMPACCFVLKDLPVKRYVWEYAVGWSVTGTTFVRHGISDLASGVARATQANQRASATAAAISVEVDATTGWAAEGLAFWEQESVVYTALFAGPPRIGSMTRGAFHSEAIEHPYDARDRNRPDDVGWEPVLTTYPVSWKGRRVQLWLAEAVPGMTDPTVRRVWNGKVKALQMQPDGVTWQLLCESLWDAQRAEVCSGLPKTRLRGTNMPECEVTWTASLVGAGPWQQPRRGSYTMAAAAYQSAQELLTAFVTGLNDSLAADAVVTQRFSGLVGDDGRMAIIQTEPQGAGDWSVFVSWWDSDTLETFFGGNAGCATLPHVNGDDFAWRAVNLASDFVVVLNAHAVSTIAVDSTEDFDDLELRGAGYEILMGCIISDVVFYIREVAGNTLTIRPVMNQPEAITVTPDASGAVMVQACVIVSGEWQTFWREFLENASIPPRWRIGLRSSDWDWTEIEGLSPGGIGVARQRVIAKPLPFRDMVLEDIRFAGLVPAISGTDAKLSVRLLGPPGEAQSLGALNEMSHDLTKLPRLTYAEDLLVSAVQVKAKQIGWGRGDTEYEVSVDHPRIAALFGGGGSMEIGCDGLGFAFRAGRVPFSPEDFAAYATLLAMGVFEMFGSPAWVGECPCTIRPGLMLPGDAAHVTHATWLDSDTGERGIVDTLCLITSVRVEPFRAATQVTVWVPGDPARRSGWAPCAKITAYTDDGAGAGAKRYRLTVDTGIYAVDEGPLFKDGMLVTLVAWDDATPVSEDFEISADGDTGAVYVTVPPAVVPTPIVGEWRLHFRPYDTALQTDAAKAYVHVCDEDDLLIGTTTDRGFKAA